MEDEQTAGTAVVAVAMVNIHALPAHTAWTAAQRAAFLDHFATNADVRSAAMMIGMTARDAYALRRTDAAFAAEWRGAIDVAYDRLEIALVKQLSGGSRSRVNVGAAMLLLEQRRAGARGAKGPWKAGAGDERARAERELLRRLKTYAGDRA